MVHAGCVSVAGIHPSRIWTSGSFESLRWKASVHRLDLGIYSHPKEFRGNGVKIQVNSKGKIPSTGKILPRGGSNSHTILHQAGHRDQHSANELFRTPWTKYCYKCLLMYFSISLALCFSNEARRYKCLLMYCSISLGFRLSSEARIPVSSVI